MNEEQMKAIQAIDDYFKSGNSVPVSRATIKREEWEMAKAALASQAKSVPDGWKLVPIELSRKQKQDMVRAYEAMGGGRLLDGDGHGYDFGIVQKMHEDMVWAYEEAMGGGRDEDRYDFEIVQKMHEAMLAAAPQAPTDDRVRELEALVDKLLEADMTAQLNGGGAYARHTVPAILELRKFRAKQRQAKKEDNK